MACPMLKLTILGDGGVGKTALVIQLCLNKFVETYDPTIEDSYRTRVVLDDQAMTLELMDTAGQEEYATLRDQWIHEGEGFLIVYSVTSRQSFMQIRQHFQEISRIKADEPFGVALVGNKIDEENREVSYSEGERLAQQWGVPFFETSAKKNINTASAFIALARLTQDKRQEFCGSAETEAVQMPSSSQARPQAKVQVPPNTSSTSEKAPAPQVNPQPVNPVNPPVRSVNPPKSKKKKRCVIM